MLNSTILSTCFNNLSFVHPNNISKEDNFIEEEIIEDPFDEEGSFLMKLKHEEVCKNNDISQIS